MNLYGIYFIKIMYKFIVHFQKGIQLIRIIVSNCLKNVHSTKVAGRDGCNYVDRTVFAGHLSEG